MEKNKIYAVKKGEDFWAVIDCGETKQGGMTVGNFWSTHFRRDGRTYRWYDKIFSPPDTLKEWQEISVITKQVVVIDANGHSFEGWNDADDLCYTTLKRFADLIGVEISLDQIKEKILTP